MNCATDGVGAAAVVAAGIDGYWHQWLVQFVRPTHFINANATKKERNQGIIQMKKIQREKKKRGEINKRLTTGMLNASETDALLAHLRPLRTWRTAHANTHIYAAVPIVAWVTTLSSVLQPASDQSQSINKILC